jgi:NitT/TauT family transport system ATP-binding protein
MRVVIQSLQHTFNRPRPPRRALEDITVEIPSGQFAAIIGPSGCGKSTLLRLIGDLLPSSRGRILLDGHSPGEMRKARRIAWMAQSPALLPWLTARENVSLAQQFMPANGHQRISPEDALKRVGLGDAAAAYPFSLSGGMQQRLALARLLALDAGVWLMDEPFAALDELTREHLAGELLEMWQPLKPTVLWVTQNIYEAVRLADRVLVLSPAPGRITADLRIDLPRPRIEVDPGFQTVLQTIRAALNRQTGSAGAQ